ncbi:MAG: hypothetical protein MZV63_50980 [Marinilabiliales bacterium]|nr:hypothetical protein [Marinilabiliales bacterium]
MSLGKSETRNESGTTGLSVKPFIKTIHYLHRLVLVTLGRWGEDPVFRVIRIFDEKMLRPVSSRVKGSGCPSHS